MIKIKRSEIEALSYEGERGTMDLAELIGKLGYNTLTDFFIDNPGVVEAIYDWISYFYGEDDPDLADNE